MAGAIFALLAVVAALPGSARAGCLIPHDSASHFEHLVRAGALPEAAEHDEAARLPGKPPTCSGPLCSRGPAAPSSSWWAATPGPESWACLAEGLAPVASSSSPLPPEVATAPPAGLAPSLFHPPRHSSV